MDENSNDRDVTSAPAQRQPYEKPSIVWEEEIAVRPTLMAACGKVPTQSDECTAAPGS